jgi:methyl-accepting chemotaxis protein
MTDGGVVAESDGESFEMVADEDLVDEDGPDLNVDDEVLLDGVGLPVFMLDTNHDIAAWNHGMEQFTGVRAAEALGHDCASELFYPDGRRSRTIADEVLDAPRTADEEFGLTLEDESLFQYADETTMVDRYGEERHLRLTSMPLYEDDELVAVVETVRDRTDEVRRQRDVEELVDEVHRTLRALTGGNLAARASYDSADRVLNRHLLSVVDELNEMAEQFEQLAARVDEQADTLAGSVDQSVDAARDIARNVGEQNDLLAECAGEMQTFSASMEEVAATAEQVDTAASRARESAAAGLDASEGAREATEAVFEIGDDLVASVTDLGERMDDIEAVVEVISDVADQTNLLALNANIEAARAGEAGSGFAVVANEVKNLADETRSHTTEITRNIEALQERTAGTVDAATESHRRIEHAGGQIADVLAAFEEIASNIDEAADGVAEVSRATDDQAASVEELTATIEEVRERADETESATARIVEATEEGTTAIDELSARVRELYGGTGDDGGEMITDGGVVGDDGMAGDVGTSDRIDGFGGFVRVETVREGDVQ